MTSELSNLLAELSTAIYHAQAWGAQSLSDTPNKAEEHKALLIESLRRCTKLAKALDID